MSHTRLSYPNFLKIKERLNLWGKRYSADRKTFLNNYYSEEWDKTLYEAKVKHSLFNCAVCKGDPELKQIYKIYPLKNYVRRKNADVCNKENKETKPNPKQVKAIKRKMKNEIEEIKKKTCVERTFGNNISLKQRQILRLQESFESVSDCKTRTKKDAD